MKKLISGLFIACLLGSLVCCNRFMDRDIPPEVRKIYDELGEIRTSARPAIDFGGTRPAYINGTIDQFVDGLSGYPRPRRIIDWDWTGVGEGDIKLYEHNLIGDGLEVWIFLSIQNGKHYIVYANNQNEKMPMGISQGLETGKYVWFFSWE